jgi:hypothetical protein
LNIDLLSLIDGELKVILQRQCFLRISQLWFFTFIASCKLFQELFFVVLLVEIGKDHADFENGEETSDLTERAKHTLRVARVSFIVILEVNLNHALILGYILFCAVVLDLLGTHSYIRMNKILKPDSIVIVYFYQS